MTNFIQDIENLNSEDLKQYRDKYNQKKLGGMYLAFVILKKEEINFDKILNKLSKEWCINITDYTVEKDKLKVKYNCYEILLSYHNEVLPSAMESFEKNHRFVGKVVLRSQKAYISVTVIKTDAPDYKGTVSDEQNEANIETATFFVRAVTCTVQATSATGVEYFDVGERAEDYIERTIRTKELVVKIPVYNLFFVGYGETKKPFNFDHIYSIGLESFYKKDMEVNVKIGYIDNPFNFLQMSCVHMIINNYSLEDKDTICLDDDKDYDVKLLENNRLELVLLKFNYAKRLSELLEKIKSDLSELDVKELVSFELIPHNKENEEDLFFPYCFSLIINEIEKTYEILSREEKSLYADEDGDLDRKFYTDIQSFLQELFLKIIACDKYRELNKVKGFKENCFACKLYFTKDNDTGLVDTTESIKFTKKLIKDNKNR